MKTKIALKDLDQTAKYFLALFLLTISIGITIGLFYVYLTTDLNNQGIVEQFNGSAVQGNDIPVKFEKPLENMILTTHNHINTFSIITLLIGIIFYFNSIVSGKIKLFFILEPFISILLTFSSMWMMRYFHENFVYLVIISAVLMYTFWYLMIFISMYELIFKKSSKNQIN